MWRDIEITSVSSVAKLCYTIIAAFEGEGTHLFGLKYKENRYEIVIDEDLFEDFFDEPAIDPVKTKLSSLNLSIKDTLELEYDYGAGWEFDIKLVSITEMKKGTGNHYPFVTAGKGRGIIEDTSPYELLDMIKETEKTGKLPILVDYFSGSETEWDYRKFNLDYCNSFLKDSILDMKEGYEGIE